MVASHLTAISDSTDDDGCADTEVVDLGRGPEIRARRIRQLQREARKLAREQIEFFAHALSTMGERAAEIANGGEAYPVGARELSSRMADDLSRKAQLLVSIISRTASD